MKEYEIGDLFFSGFAIILSICSLIYSMHISKKQNVLEMRLIYYKSVFENFLLNEIPRVFNNFVNLQNGTVSVTASTDFEDTIHQFRTSIKFLQFNDSKFYNELDRILIGLDELIVQLCTSEEKKEERIDQLYQLTKNLYKKINKYYKL